MLSAPLKKPGRIMNLFDLACPLYYNRFSKSGL